MDRHLIHHPELTARQATLSLAASSSLLLEGLAYATYPPQGQTGPLPHQAR